MRQAIGMRQTIRDQPLGMPQPLGMRQAIRDASGD